MRRYAYAQLGDTTRRTAHGQLRNYFAEVEVPPRVENLDDLLPLIELYHHTVRAGQFDEARTLFRDRIHDPIYYQFGAYQVQIDLLQAREAALQSPLAAPSDHATTALTAARHALKLADETAHSRFPYARDYVRAHWLLGAAHRVNGALSPDTEQHFIAAGQHLTEALTRCRSINLVEMEADILLELARLRVATGNRDAALHLAQEALAITERCGYVLQGADVHLLLAGLLDHESREKALAHARAARRLATCDGPPDHTYPVAYDEAGQLLARLGEPPTDG